MHSNKQGFILILSLMVIALAVTLVTYIFHVGSVQMPFSRIMIDREKAKLLALSGIHIAQAKLSQEVPIPKKEETSHKQAAQQQQVQKNKAQEEPPELQAAKKLLQEIVPTLNRWQTFVLKEEIDGIDGTIKLCMGSEEGKLDLNALYDFEKHVFKGDKTKQELIKQLLQSFFKRIEKEELYSEFEKFLKARQYRFDDITELLRIPGFVAFKDSLFYPGPLKQKEEKNKTPVYLTDVFTVWSGKQTVEPWLLSHSMCGLVGVKQTTMQDIESRKKAVEQAVKEFKLAMQWPADWKKYLAPLYQTEFNALITNSNLIFSTQFEPTIFSVLSYGIVGEVTQKVYAILERTEEKNDKKLGYNVTIKKLYWL